MRGLQAKRTAFGAFGGKFAKLSATDLAVHAGRAAVAEAGVDPAVIDASIWGNVAQTSVDAAYLARHAGLEIGMDKASTAITLNRLCGSGFQSVVTAAESIMTGQAHLVLAGGTESMSQAPLSVYGHNVRFGHRLGADLSMQDTLWSALTDPYAKIPMGMTAEKLAEQYNVTRADADEYGLQSQQRWKAAQDAGVFAAEIAPVTVKGKRGPEEVSVDEHPRPEATLERMGKLPSVFKPDGTVTAANASGIGDGAAAILVASERAVREFNLPVLARVRGWGVAGVDPTEMGIGPCPAIRSMLGEMDASLDSVNHVEVNEAFASQYLAVERELGLNRDITNIHGGAIALAHPLGASGARIITHLPQQVNTHSHELVVGSACIGGGQGIAISLGRA
jgi:acetyl-CoA acyltransferase 2